MLAHTSAACSRLSSRMQFGARLVPSINNLRKVKVMETWIEATLLLLAAIFLSLALGWQLGVGIVLLVRYHKSTRV